jgi:hypothetical protein
MGFEGGKPCFSDFSASLDEAFVRNIVGFGSFEYDGRRSKFRFGLAK